MVNSVVMSKPDERTNDVRQKCAVVMTDAPCSHRLGWRTTATSLPQVITIRTNQVSTSPLADVPGVFALFFEHRVAQENIYIRRHIRPLCQTSLLQIGWLQVKTLGWSDGSEICCASTISTSNQVGDLNPGSLQPLAGFQWHHPPNGPLHAPYPAHNAAPPQGAGGPAPPRPPPGHPPAAPPAMRPAVGRIGRPAAPSLPYLSVARPPGTMLPGKATHLRRFLGSC